MKLDELKPEQVLDLAEEILQEALSPVFRPLHSYINRVFELRTEAGQGIVIKFYRPGRWSLAALQEEQAFVYDLAAAELPVVAPLRDHEGSSLFEERGIWASIMPRCHGRPFEDPAPEEWQELGRTLARLHRAGEERPAAHRVTWHPEEASQQHLDLIYDICGEEDEAAMRYLDLAEERLEQITPLFEQIDFLRIHGDLHGGNLIRRPGEAGLMLIDFDDMAMGPAVQDLWMLLPGAAAESAFPLQEILKGYRQFRDFDPQEIDLIEPLRAMRYIHFAAWNLSQLRDNPLRRLQADCGSPSWWQREIGALRELEW